MATTSTTNVGSESQDDSRFQEKNGVLPQDQQKLRSITLQDTQTGQAEGPQSFATNNDTESQNSSNLSVQYENADHDSNDVNTDADDNTLEDHTKPMADGVGSDYVAERTTGTLGSNSDFDKTKCEAINTPESKTDILKKTENQGKPPKNSSDADRNDEKADNETDEEINEKQDKSPKDSYEEDDNGVPIDRGWAWMIDLSCFTMYLVYTTLFQFHSILLLDYTERFDCPVSVITAMLSATSIAYCIATQVSTNVLVIRFTNRSVAVVACIANVAASLVFAASVNIPTFFIATIVKSVARGCCQVPTLTMVGFYFRRRRALATGLAILGTSVCSVVTPPLIRFLREEYGFRGSFLLLAGFEMHAIVAALLLRPLSSYKPKTSNSKIDILSQEEQAPLLHAEIKDSPATSQSTGLVADKLPVPSSKVGKTSITEGTEFQTEKTALKNTSLQNMDEMCGVDVVGEKDNQADEGVPSRVKHSVTGQDTKKDFHLKPANNQCCQSDVGYCQNGHSSHEITEVIVTKDQTENLKNVSLDKSKPSVHNEAAGAYSPIHLSVSKVIEKTSSWSLDSESLMGSALNMTSVHKPKSEVLSEHEVKPGVRCSYCSWMGMIVDVSLLKNFLCLMLFVCYVFGTNGFYSSLFLPSYAIKVGVSAPKAAILLTIVGAVDTVGRILVGLFADLKLVRPNVIIAVSCLLIGSLNFLAQLYQGFGELVFFAVMLGLLSNVAFGLHTSLITDVMGMNQLTKLWALSSLFGSMGAVIQHPIHGALIEATGNFVATFHYVGASLILAAVLLLSEPFIRKLQLAREKKTNALRSQVQASYHKT